MEKNNPLDFEEIVHQEAKKVFNLAYRLCGNQEEAKDISQETFVRAYEHFDRFQGSSRVFTYLYRITFNIWKNRLRHWSRHPTNSPSSESLFTTVVTRPIRPSGNPISMLARAAEPMSSSRVRLTAQAAHGASSTSASRFSLRG